MLVVNGWQIFAHPLFLDQVDKLAAAVERDRLRDASNYSQTPNAKLLAALRKLVTETIPADPTRPEYRQGSTLGRDHRHWFRAKFGNGRFRLFFRYLSQPPMIIFVWVNDESSLRTYGGKRDAYAVFRKMLESGNPPDAAWSDVLNAAKAIENQFRLDESF